jgi:hypothetical protein
MCTVCGAPPRSAGHMAIAAEANLGSCGPLSARHTHAAPPGPRTRPALSRRVDHLRGGADPPLTQRPGCPQPFCGAPKEPSTVVFMPPETGRLVGRKEIAKRAPIVRHQQSGPRERLPDPWPVHLAPGGYKSHVPSTVRHRGRILARAPRGLVPRAAVVVLTLRRRR